jgi:HTH-type transcriptional regulator, competence development regulator
MIRNRSFGKFLRERRMTRAAKSRAFSVRQLAHRVGIEPSYLSKVERGEEPPPGEGTIRRIAMELGENPDVLLGLAGKVSSDLVQIIRDRPTLVGELLRSIRRIPAKHVAEMARQVRDGKW